VPVPVEVENYGVMDRTGRPSIITSKMRAGFESPLA
jgi:hypothetical protein